ncbi:MAG: hypothetical protein ACU841_02010 [Gammaproteobacteria bacterium]
MKRSYPINKTNYRLHHPEFNKKTAIHEAGHAAAIHLGNRQKELPPVFFQIYIKELNHERPARGCIYAANRHFAEVKGGRLIQILPHSMPDAISYLADEAIPGYSLAFEADIINLLVGPLAEAKYVALSDDEPISPRLVNLDSLHNYGGSSDLEIAREYLDCMSIDPNLKERKFFELFLAAYDFINEPSNWKAINALADYIVNTGKKIIDCEEAIAILDSSKLDYRKVEHGLHL